MKKLFFPFIFLILSLIYTGCYYDSNEALFGKPDSAAVVCDTTVTNFTAQVKPILQSYCYSCHANAYAAGSGSGIKLENYADVKIYADNGKLMGSIQHISGYSAMPKGGGSLSSCDIKIIKSWITRGKLNN